VILLKTCLKLFHLLSGAEIAGQVATTAQNTAVAADQQRAKNNSQVLQLKLLVIRVVINIEESLC